MIKGKKRCNTIEKKEYVKENRDGKNQDREGKTTWRQNGRNK